MRKSSRKERALIADFLELPLPEDPAKESHPLSIKQVIEKAWENWGIGQEKSPEQVISENWVRDAITPDSDAVDYGALYDGYPLGYGYQWWLFPDGRFEAQGLFGQLIYIAPDQNIVIVKLSAWPEGVVDEMEFESYAFFEAAISALEDF